MRAVLAAALAAAALACAAEPSGTVELRPGAVVDGGTVETFRQVVAEHHGTPLVVNFWATWCEPCRDEMPRLVDAFERYGSDVAFLGIDVEDDVAAAAAFVERFGVPFAHLADPTGAIRRDQGILGLPVTQFYRADGELAFVHNGEITEADLEEKIGELLRLAR